MKINNIQVLRAVAALLVVFHHSLTYTLNVGNDPKYLKIFQGFGEIGVDIFFVISGFVIVHSQYLNPKTSFQFIISRLVRIVPLYWFLTITTFIVAIFFPHIFSSGFSVSNLWFIQSLTFTSFFLTNNHPMIYLGWTLEYEMLFYVCFALSILTKKINNIIIVTAMIFTFLILFFNTNIIIYEFILGMIIGKILIFYKFKSISSIYFIVYLFLFTSLIFIHDLPFMSKIHNLFYFGIPSAVLVYLLASIPQTKNRLLIYLGDSSYSIYLIQFFSIPLFYKLLFFSSLNINDNFIPILCLFFSAGVGVTTFYFLENRLTKYIKNIFQPS